MSTNDPWTDPQNATPTPAKKGMSGCMLATLIVGGVGLVVGVLCCGGSVWFGSMFIPKITKVPAEVAAVGHQILDVEVLPDFTGDEAMSIDNQFMTVRIAKFKQKEGKGGLLMGTAKMKIGDANQPGSDPSVAFRTQAEEEVMGPLDTKKTESHEIMIDGQKVMVAVGEANERGSNKAVHTVTADFDLPTGKTFFRLKMDDDIWNEEAVLKMLEDTGAGHGH